MNLTILSPALGEFWGTLGSLVSEEQENFEFKLIKVCLKLI